MSKIKKNLENRIIFKTGFLSILFFILIINLYPVSSVKAETTDFILSGGPNSTDNICVDDDIYVYLNGNLIYSDIDPYNATCNNQPISLKANSGDELKVVAVDSVGVCRGIGPIWLHFNNQSLQLDSGVNDGCNFWPAGVTFYNKTFTISKPKKDPVILIPGIMGSWVVGGKLVLDPILHTYDQLYKNLQVYGDYKEGEMLFSFPYDWTFSNTTTAQFLQNKINEVKLICHCDKVDLVAHSMGGLVARYYIESDLYQDDVDQMVFLATPHLGSPKSYLAWEGGDLGPEWTEIIQELFLKQVAKASGFNSIYDYVKNLPVSPVQQSLPIYDYLQDKDTGIMRQYPNNYPVNEFLESLHSEENLNKLYDRVKIINIYGDLENEGIDIIKVVPQKLNQIPLWEYGYPENYGLLWGDHGLTMSNGDKTVPLKSAIAINADKSQRLVIDHQNLVSYSSSYVLDALSGQWVNITVQDQPEEYLIIQVHSPVDFLVIAPDGKKIGKDFEQNISLNEIEGAFYSGFDAEVEFVVIPNPLEGKYQIQTIGTGEGIYQLDVNYIDTGKGIGGSESFTANVVPDRIDNFNINFNSDNPVEPIGDLTPDDAVAPEIIINSPKEKKYLHSEIIPIDFQVTDNFSGVSTTATRLDGNNFTDSQIDLFFQNLGEHIFKIQAQDKAGNISEKEIKFQIIATVESLIQDIKRCYQENWIKNEKTKNSLINDVERARKWYNILEKVKEKIKNPKAKERIEEIQIKIILKSFKLRLKVLLKLNLINQQAYNLLLKQVEYIINNL